MVRVFKSLAISSPKSRQGFLSAFEQLFHCSVTEYITNSLPSLVHSASKSLIFPIVISDRVHVAIRYDQLPTHHYDMLAFTVLTQ